MQTVNSKKYIEIDSTYRNRIEYPFQAQFKINVGNAGQTIGLNNAKDPITGGTSEWVWGGTSFIGLSSIDGVSSAIVWTPTVPGDGRIPGRGYFITDTTTGERALVDSIVIGNGSISLSDITAVLETPFSDSWTSGAGGGRFETFQDASHIHFPFGDRS